MNAVTICFSGRLSGGVWQRQLSEKGDALDDEAGHCFGPILLYSEILPKRALEQSKSNYCLYQSYWSEKKMVGWPHCQYNDWFRTAVFWPRYSLSRKHSGKLEGLCSLLGKKKRSCLKQKNKDTLLAICFCKNGWHYYCVATY